jgi:hypothetical protein
LTSVNIGNSVTSIGNYAFQGCTGLTSVNIGNSVTSIGNYAFQGCSGLTSITIGNSVTSIGNYAFQGCSGLTSVIIPNSVTSIGNYAFSGCSSLSSITIGNSVTSIGNWTFDDCSGLTKVIVPDLAAWCKIDFKSELSNPLFYGNHLYADDETEITNLIIPNNVTTIGDYAFILCSGLTSLTIPNSVTSIGLISFAGCSNLTSIQVESGNTVYDSRENCNAVIKTSENELIVGCVNTVIPNNVTSIGDRAFVLCSGLTSITIPNSVTSIGTYAFYGCSGLTSITIPNSVTEIGDYAFADCSGLICIIVSDNLTHLESKNPTPFPKTDECRIYVNKKSYGLLTLWKAGYTPYELGTDNRLYPPYFQVVNIDNPSPTTMKAKISSIYQDLYYWFDSNKEEIPLVPTKATETTDTIDFSLTGLTPNSNYKGRLNVAIDKTDKEYTYVINDEISYTTASLKFTTLQPKVATPGNVIVAATSNIDDAETNVGFEWRRTDWTDDFASNSGQAFLYEGTMEGYIRNLNTDKLWKFRPYYESASGKRYYGEWMGLDPTNTSYFEPTVHTYALQVVDGNTAQVRGYAMRGSDNTAQQGFKYWKSTNNARAMASGVSVPKDAQTVEAKGVVMEAELTGLDYSSTYCYVAFVTTTEGETFYGEQQTLQTGEDVTGIETPIMATANDGMLRIYSLNGRMVATQQGGSVETLLTGLRPGLYIVSNGQKAWKVLK